MQLKSLFTCQSLQVYQVIPTTAVVFCAYAPLHYATEGNNGTGPRMKNVTQSTSDDENYFRINFFFSNAAYKNGGTKDQEGNDG